MLSGYGSLPYLFNTLLFRIPLRRKVRAEKLLAAMSKWPFRPAALTCAGKTDGGGAQVHAVLSVLSFCETFGYRYVHTPFNHMEHTSSTSDVRAWDDLFNLGEGEIAAARCEYPVIPASVYIKSPGLWFRRVAVAVEQLHGFSNAHPDAYLRIREAVRRKYAGRPIVREDDYFRIAVHIRRGDAHGVHSVRLTDDSRILARIDAARRACAAMGRNSHVTIHSQGRQEDFAAFSERGYELQLNAPPLQSLNALVHADVLLMAKSSFSFVVGILNSGVVIYDPFWHPPLPDWIDAGEINKLDEQIHLSLSKKMSPSTRAVLNAQACQSSSR